MQTRSQATIERLKQLRHPQCDEIFQQALHSIFRQWTALNLAITNQWGGPNSHEKANLLLNDIMHMFQGPEKIYKDDISLILEDSMETDFNTECEDGSPDEIGELLVQLWKECSSGEFHRIQNILDKEKKLGNVLQQSQGLQNGDELDEEDDDLIVCSMSEVVSIANDRMNSTSNTLMPVIMEGDENDQEIVEPTRGPIVDADGWETVIKSKSKKKLNVIK